MTFPQSLPPPLPMRRRDHHSVHDSDDNDPPRTPPHLPPRIQPSSSSSNIDVVPPLPPRGAFSHVRTPSGALKLSRPPPIVGAVGNLPPPPPSPIVNLPHAGSPTFVNGAQTSPITQAPSSGGGGGGGGGNSASSSSSSAFRSAAMTSSSTTSSSSASGGVGGTSHPPILARRHSTRTFFPHDMTLPIPSNAYPTSATPHLGGGGGGGGGGFGHPTSHHNPPAHSTTPSAFDNHKFEFPSSGFPPDSSTAGFPDAPIPQLPPKTSKYHRKKVDNDS